MEKVLILNKLIGQTPLEAIREFQEKNPEYQKVKLGYAGRLDPMAEGLLLVLVGEENKNKTQYQDLDKEYECEVLFGVSTDTYDVLGLVSRVIADSDPQSRPSKNEILKQVQDDIKKYKGERLQVYPPYSSKTVNGKPLFEYARENKLEEIKIPQRKITIYSIKVQDFITLNSDSLKSIILNKIGLVSGDFRQEEIKKGWEVFFTENKSKEFLVARFVVHCSSGTYIRSIAHEIGEKLGTGAIALSIKRTRVGEFLLD